MKMTFRWYGENDSISLEKIRQIPNMYSVVTAVYDVPVGEVWPEENIARLKSLCEAKGLKMEVIESVPVHEDIKIGLPTRDKYIEAYKENIRRLGKAGVKCICYNFMPVFDWTRTQLDKVAFDGSNSLVYYPEQIKKMNPLDGSLSLPGWDSSYKKEDLKKLFEQYASVDEDKLFENLEYFLKAIIPVCEEYGVNMAIHPDDPPWDMFGLPRIITCEESYDRLFEAVPQINNGITFCTGSLGASRKNDLVKMAKKYAKRIHFAHLRQIKYDNELDFTESGHMTASGSLDIYGIVKALVEGGFDGYVRPDHGRNIWGEDGKPGYGLYDRALGAAYLNGLFEAVENEYKEANK